VPIRGQTRGAACVALVFFLALLGRRAMCSLVMNWNSAEAAKKPAIHTLQAAPASVPQPKSAVAARIPAARKLAAPRASDSSAPRGHNCSRAAASAKPSDWLPSSFAANGPITRRDCAKISSYSRCGMAKRIVPFLRHDRIRFAAATTPLGNLCSAAKP